MTRALRPAAACPEKWPTDKRSRAKIIEAEIAVRAARKRVFRRLIGKRR
jgi:hypothetical protein